jgi:hypothetical protein
MSAKIKCIVCCGTGHRFCWKCGGSGKREFNPWEISLTKQGDCDRCRGSGRDPDPDPTCKGTGLVGEQQTRMFAAGKPKRSLQKPR